MTMTPNALNTVARIILNGIIVHMPEVPPERLELILARVARLYRERIAERESQAAVAAFAAPRAAAVKKAQAEEAQHKAEVSASRRKPIASEDLLPLPPIRRRKLKYPRLSDQLRALLAEQPEIRPTAAMRHFESTYGPNYLTYPGFKLYWDAANKGVTE